ncbi:hypothetical protein FEM48_Zijuj01G0213900 [Ziziphus jujuba var. spinosa]|uniref:Retrovirus-related Pol polyprotein from transposon TNT 1-94 n=1 Tax=Ziziphus jujuba var. spinosa TaxID=714518 RepID=A0A978W3M8_ZIZJJ|nr:hypothetical protein FEM48_Zijuj01G0213900 [Ziziphus jujuba var. spinosa]
MVIKPDKSVIALHRFANQTTLFTEMFLYQIPNSNLFIASENFVQPAIPRFDGHYDHWSMLIENFLRSKEYWQAIDHSILETILNKDTSKQIWDSMKTKYQGTARAKRVRLQALRAEFENLRMKSGELVSEYLSRTIAIVNKMRIHGEKLEMSL